MVVNVLTLTLQYNFLIHLRSHRALFLRPLRMADNVFTLINHLYFLILLQPHQAVFLHLRHMLETIFILIANQYQYKIQTLFHKSL